MSCQAGRSKTAGGNGTGVPLRTDGTRWNEEATLTGGRSETPSRQAKTPSEHTCFGRSAIDGAAMTGGHFQLLTGALTRIRERTIVRSTYAPKKFSPFSTSRKNRSASESAPALRLAVQGSQRSRIRARRSLKAFSLMNPSASRWL
jgi:hypothetical protein